MTDAESLSDDYVAGLLAKDARESSIKYSALGMEAFLPSKVAANKPKPNTRFLRNIIKETDSHNAALLAKEAADARARLKNLATKENISGTDIRRRQLGQITAHLTGHSTKRHRSDKDNQQEDRKRRRNTSSIEPELAGVRQNPTKYKERTERDRVAIEGSREHRSSRHRSHKRRRSRSNEPPRRLNHESSKRLSRSPAEHRRSNADQSGRLRDRNTSGTSSPLENEDVERHRSRRDRENADKYRSHRRRRSPSATDEDTAKEREKGKNEPSMQSKAAKFRAGSEDSDPLDDIIGPRPPLIPKIRSRGRGTISAASGIDFRFSTAYDPTVDVQLDQAEEDDWDQALEALRDRQKWKQQGADRLRAAGFTEEEVEKWKSSGAGGEKRESDVKWAKKGEGREWDRGKVFDAAEDDDDQLPPLSRATVDVEFGRLKGT